MLKIAINTVFLCLSLFCTTSIFAHDIGVSKTELHEKSNNTYILRVKSGPTIANVFGSPVLPEDFQFVSLPSGSRSGAWKIFEFSGPRPLQASDTLVLPWDRDGIMLQVLWLDGSNANRLIKNESGVITVSMDQLKAGSGSWTDGAKRYFSLGFEHILLGIDHLLFVLGLLWIVQGGANLIKTITAFTVAHSITLGLATFGFLTLPPAPVEACIALSIVFLAVEISHASKGRYGLSYRKPWLVAFAFGLLHGLGFAGALSDIGLPNSELPLALLFFNVGVEFGQLAFVGIMLILASNIRNLNFTISPRMHRVPVYLIGGVASYWLFTRMVLLGTIST